MRLNYLKLIGAVVFGSYFARAMAMRDGWHLIDGANLVFHEAGHFLFAWGPYWLEIAGGSIMQLLVPLTFVGYGWWRGQRLLAGFSLMWIGQSLANVSVYAADALKMELPLLGGPESTHDWNHLLWYFGQLRHASEVAAFILAVGFVCLIAGFGVAAWSACDEDRSVVDNPLS